MLESFQLNTAEFKRMDQVLQREASAFGEILLRANAVGYVARIKTFGES